ncbi:MAG: hypothetical protein QOK10_2650 [Pseudonocardiales bacterium]|nr:hypothetical protein [Pseudonocardiales bacterium]
MTDTANTTILVIGSTGKTGSRVVDQLERRGIRHRRGSRSADIPFDWDNPQTGARALAGVDTVYLTYYPDLAVPGSVDAVGKVTELGTDAGVSRLVLLRLLSFRDAVAGGRRRRGPTRQLRVGTDRRLHRDAYGIRSAARLYLAVGPPVHRGARQQGTIGRRCAAGVGTRAEGFRRLRSRGRRDRSVDAVSLNLAERISVPRRESAQSEGNRDRKASRSRCASNTRPRIRIRLSGGRFSSSMPRSHRRNQRFSIEPTSSSSSAISPNRTVSNIRACAMSAGCAGRAQPSARAGTRRGRGTHTGRVGSKSTSRGIDSTHRSCPSSVESATPQVHRPVKFRCPGVTVRSLWFGVFVR